MLFMTGAAAGFGRTPAAAAAVISCIAEMWSPWLAPDFIRAGFEVLALDGQGGTCPAWLACLNHVLHHHSGSGSDLFNSTVWPLPTPLSVPPAELLARIEAHPDSQLSAQDMEIAVSKALEQAV